MPIFLIFFMLANFARASLSVEQALARVREVTCRDLLVGPEITPGSILLLGDAKSEFHDLRSGELLHAGLAPFGRFVRRGEHGGSVVLWEQFLGSLPARFDAPANLAPAPFRRVARREVEIATTELTWPHPGLARLAALNEFDVKFQAGEIVRARSADGSMRDMIYEPGQREVAFNKVRPAAAFTPDLSGVWWTGIPLTNSDSLVRQLLDTAARFSSLPEFLELYPGMQIFEIARLIQVLVPARKAALRGELCGLLSFNDYVQIGMTACRHLVPILATALTEAGFQVALVSWRKPLGSHLWLEVYSERQSGAPITFIVDASWNSEPVVNDAEQLLEWASDPEDRAHLESMGYFSPERQIHELAPR